MRAIPTGIGLLGDETVSEGQPYAYFPDYLPMDVIRQGWFDDDKQYESFAALVFAHRNRDHPYADYVRSWNPEMTDQEIVSLQKGWRGIAWQGMVADASGQQSPIRSKFIGDAIVACLFITFYGAVFAGLYLGIDPETRFLQAYPYGFAAAVPFWAGVEMYERHENKKKDREQ